MVSSRTIGAIVVIVIIVLVAASYTLLVQKEKETLPSTPPPISTPTTTPTVTETVSPTETVSSPVTTPSPSPTPSPTTTPTETTPTTKTTPTPVKCTEEVELTILTRHPADIQKITVDLFLKSEVAEKYCIKNIRFIPLPPGFWAPTIKKQAIDVAWGGGPTLFDSLYFEGLLRPLQGEYVLQVVNQIPDKIAGVPTKRIDEEGNIYWVAAAIASFGFTVNMDVASELDFDVSKLRSWRDLASDELGLVLATQGIPPISVADPLQSTSNTRMYEIILQAYGWEEGWRILTLMAANADIREGSGDVRDAVIVGEVLAGITIDFYGYTAERVNPACRYVLPEGETIVNGDPIAVTVSTDNPEAAEAFIAWILSEGQKIWLDPSINRLPSNPRVFDTPEGQKRLDLKRAFEQALTTKAIEFNDTLALMVEYPMQLFWVATLKQNHDLLQEAWSALLKAYYIDKSIDRNTFEKLKNKLTELIEYKDPVTGEKRIFTLEDAIRVNEILRKDPQIREAYMNAWREAAKTKYLEVLAALGK